MTVKELMDRLTGLDPSLTVIMPGETEGFCVVAEVFIDTVHFDDNGIPCLADERDGVCMEVVRLFEDD